MSKSVYELIFRCHPGMNAVAEAVKSFAMRIKELFEKERGWNASRCAR